MLPGSRRKLKTLLLEQEEFAETSMAKEHTFSRIF
jgi:hypothetical protein